MRRKMFVVVHSMSMSEVEGVLAYRSSPEIGGKVHTPVKEGAIRRIPRHLARLYLYTKQVLYATGSPFPVHWERVCAFISIVH